MFLTILYSISFISILILGILSLHAKDFNFIVHNTFDFFLELFFLAIIPAILYVAIFVKTRKLNTKSAQILVFTIILKLMIFHILFQTSGLYTRMFG